MSATNSEKEGRAKGVEFVFTLALLTVFLHHYWYSHPLFSQIPPVGTLHPAEFMDRILIRLHERHGLFIHPLVSKIAAFFLFVLYGIGSRGKINPALTVQRVYQYAALGTALYFLDTGLLYLRSPMSPAATGSAYALLDALAVFWIIKAGQYASRIMFFRQTNDIFNHENETFPQNEEFRENPDSIHFKTLYYHQKKWRDGWINIINPYRANMVLGTPGSGKSFAILVPAIWQSIWKGYTAYIYDFKFPTLTLEAYNAYRKTLRENPGVWSDRQGRSRVPRFCIINFDDIEYSHRCNPLLPSGMTEILDGYQSAATIMLNLNRTWVDKQGDFFVESAINFLTSVIWYMKLVTIKYTRLYEQELARAPAERDERRLALYSRFRNVCTFPHILEFACQKDYREMFTIMASYPQLEAYVRPFASAAQHGAAEQLEGQIASVRIPLARLSSETLYWIMSGNDFNLDINNPDDPKILCTGNNPERDEVYGAVFSLYTSKMMKLVNRQHKLKSALFWDELPTMYLKGISSLMATARSNRVATWLGFQDFEQLATGYGEKESKVIMNLPGNVFSGQVVFESAEKLSRRFGKTQQESENVTFGREDTSVTLSTALHEVIPASKISSLSQGEFVGQFADNFGEEMPLKTFRALIRVDQKGMKKSVGSPPPVTDIGRLVRQYYPGAAYDPKDKEQWKTRILEDNYSSIKQEVAELIRLEYEEFRSPEGHPPDPPPSGTGQSVGGRQV